MTTGKVALIAGMTGQDGACPAGLPQECEIHGVKRRFSSFDAGRIEGIHEDPHVEGANVRLCHDDLDVRRDRARAREYMRGMCLMLRQDMREDYTLAAGETTRARAFVEIDPRCFRPTEVELPIGDLAKAREKLNWRHETSVRDLAREMVQADLAVMRDAPIGKGV